LIPQRHISGNGLKGRDKLFGVSEEVRDAVATGKPVVALETTIYTHGMSDILELWVFHG
jgi:pseudouridine-5'-phosphate glycosidase